MLFDLLKKLQEIEKHIRINFSYYILEENDESILPKIFKKKNSHLFRKKRCFIYDKTFNEIKKR